MRKVSLFIASLFLAATALAQTRTVTGKVTDAADGSGMVSVSILVQGTNKGTTTDLDGNYSLELGPGETTLVFTFIGYAQQVIEVGDRTVVNVVMETDATNLEELVVVGYGEQKKSDITGSTASIKGAELAKQPVSTATQALQGKVAGVQIISSGQPGTAPQIRIRGVGTINSGAGALYVVDGVLTDDITNINSADIVDMNILKDASAAAIYGSRGANGVVIITTKKGEAGKLKVNYNNQLGFRQAVNLVEMANAEEYSNYVQAATGSAPPTSPYDTDWFDTILRTAWMQNHNLSVSGGNEHSTHFLNVGYLKEDGILLKNNFERFTTRLNSEYNLHKKITFGHQFAYNNNRNQNGFGNMDGDAFGNVGSAYNNAYRAAPIIASKIGERYGNTSAFQNVGNPLLDLNNNSILIKENRLQGSAYLNIKPLEWLSFRSSVGGDWRNTLSRGYYYQFNADETTFLTAGGNQLRNLSNLTIDQRQTFRWVIDNILTASHEFGDHSLTFMAGITSEKFSSTSVRASRNDVSPNPDLWYINTGDANTSQNGGGGDMWTRQSLLARVNYAFKEKYLFTGSLRNDGSSRLPKENRWVMYPSVGLGWIISREGFFQNQELIDFLKLRGSYGKVGNDQIPAGAYTYVVDQNKPYPFNGSNTVAENGGQITQIVDPNIGWEVTTEYDLALEFTLLQSKLQGEINYYNKKITDALINIPVLTSSGDFDGLIFQNVASIENKGIEIMLNWADKISDDLRYTLGGNITFNQNKVVALNGGQATLGGSIGAAQGFTTSSDNGHPIGSFYVLKTIGVFNTVGEVNAYVNSEGKVIQPNAKPGDLIYKDINDDGQIDDMDRVFSGSYQPVAYFGFNVGVNYKNFDLTMDFYGNVGNEVYNGKKAVRVDGRDNVEKDVVYNRWTSANQSQTEPAANTGNLPASDYFIEPGDFFRLNNITFGYTVPQSVLERLKISTLRVFVTSQNLFMLQKYSGFTPELPGSPTGSGIELNAYPTTRSIVAGLNIGF